jgi:hypothetical protein
VFRRNVPPLCSGSAILAAGSVFALVDNRLNHHSSTPLHAVMNGAYLFTAHRHISYSTSFLLNWNLFSPVYYIFRLTKIHSFRAPNHKRPIRRSETAFDIQCDKSHSCLKQDASPCVGVEFPSLSARPTLSASPAVTQNRTASSALLLDCGRGLL